MTIESSNPVTAAATRAVEALRVERRSTAALVSQTLRESIIRGELPPGMALREQAVSDALDVSRNTVREALRLLDHEGLVDYHVHRGVTVRRLSAPDVRDLYRTREALEVAAIHYSGSAPREALSELSTIVEQAGEAAAAHDSRAVATLDIVFHQGIVDLIESDRVTAFFRRIVAELRLGFAAVDPVEHHRYVPWNAELVELMLAGKRNECAAEMRAYLADAEEMVIRAIGRQAEQQRPARLGAGRVSRPVGSPHGRRPRP